MKKKITTLIIATALTAGMSMTAFAGQWQQDTTGWWYQNDDSTFAKNGWNWIDGKCYYFTPEGYCLIDTTTPDGFTVDGTGAWIVDGVIQTQTVQTSNLQTWLCDMDYYDGPEGTPSYFGVQIGNSEEYVSDIYALFDSTGTIPYTVENKPEWINCWDVQITGEIFDSPEGPAIKVQQLTVIQ